MTPPPAPEPAAPGCTPAPGPPARTPPERGDLSYGGDFSSNSAVKSPQSSKSRRSWGTGGLPREFFARPAVEVAPDLLGCVIVHGTAEGLVAVSLAEVEAYSGESDPASHAYRGRTARNAVMFGPPGHAYVYFTYGMHFCVNLVCRPEGEAQAVLLRAGRVVDGVPLACARRGSSSRRSGDVRELDLARGPARLCEALGIDRSHDGTDICDPASELRVFTAPAPVPAGGISRGPRVGVSQGADVAWRYWITGEPAVSVYRPHVPRRARAKPVTGPEPRGGTIHR